MSEAVRVIQSGPQPESSNGPPVLIEVAHGATTLLQYSRTLGLLKGKYPKGLLDFFLVNTDQGAPELAQELAHQVVVASPGRSVTIVIAEVPRTFIDVNRVPGVTTEAAKAGGVTPGLQPWVTHQDDIRLLTELHADYHQVVAHWVDRVCGVGGTMLALHTYAPRSVSATVDETIGEQMREAWSGDVNRWPLRPPIDLIGRDKGEGDNRLWLVDPSILDILRLQFTRLGLEVADAESYHLADVTMARRYRDRYPDRVVCLEVRRDLLTERWSPFAKMHCDPRQLRNIAGALQRALF